MGDLNGSIRGTLGDDREVFWHLGTSPLHLNMELVVDTLL